jgi:acetylornithine deacetylase/succinyl-diaminopimelate desuccinylase-like protein
VSVRAFVSDNGDRYLGWLQDACRIPSLASRPEGLEEMAAWLEKKLAEVGASTERLPYESAPDAVFAELGSGARTLLVYDHYDVQPVDPIALWESAPFGPEVRDGCLFARGVADNKGDLVARIAALDAYVELYGELPLKIKLLVEGEEETGSRSFEALVARYSERFAADGCMWEGAGIDSTGAPELVFGAKGLAFVELTYRGLESDQHSSLASLAPSPVWHLVEALATLRAPDGKVLIEGFYDDVLKPTRADLKMLRRLSFNEAAELNRLGISSFVGGLSGLDLLKRNYFEPTCNIAGINAGFTVPGAAKTVMPKEALAKLDLRLVPQQDPEDIIAKLRRHLDKRGYGDIILTPHSMERPARSAIDSLVGRAATAAAEAVYEQAPAVAPLMSASGPMNPIVHTLGIPTVSPAGVCRPDSRIHAPNENVRIADFLDTVEYTINWINAFAKLGD